MAQTVKEMLGGGRKEYYPKPYVRYERVRNIWARCERGKGKEIFLNYRKYCW